MSCNKGMKQVLVLQYNLREEKSMLKNRSGGQTSGTSGSTDRFNQNSLFLKEKNSMLVQWLPMLKNYVGPDSLLVPNSIDPSSYAGPIF